MVYLEENIKIHQQIYTKNDERSFLQFQSIFYLCKTLEHIPLQQLADKMSDIEAQAQQKISQLLNGVYQKLSKYSQVSDEQRQLLPSEEQLMQSLDQRSFHYQSLLRILAIDSYSSVIVNQSMLFDELCGMLTATLQYLNQLGDVIKKGGQKRQTTQKYNKISQCLSVTIKISQQMFPKNAFVEDQNKMIQSINLPIKIEQLIVQKLRAQNAELVRKSEMNELQITTMQQKLTKLLREHDDSQKGQGIGRKISNIELREELSMKQAQIQRMNEQFSFQIEKYNTVFQAMRRQLQDMKGYQNIDLIQQIQLLETEIVRLRQERQRDQIIIRQLRTDNTVFSSMGSNGYYSPRQSSRFHGSRYDY